jgi:TonB family protein
MKLVFTCCLIATLHGVGQSAKARGYPVTVSTEALLRLAQTRPMPDYPKQALARKTTGIVVASVLIAANGTMETVDILESPEPLFSDAAKAALMRWTFAPIKVQGAATASKVEGKIILYFEVTPDGGSVTVPAPQQPAAPHRDSPDLKPREVPRSRLMAFLKAGSTLLDVRERAEFRTPHNTEVKPVRIPLSELNERAVRELGRSKPIILDCSSITVLKCDGAVHVLREVGIPEISILREPER